MCFVGTAQGRQHSGGASGICQAKERGAAMRKYWPVAIAVLSLVFVGAGAARAQNDATAAINHIANAYTLVPNITYRTVSNWEAKLDIMQPRGLTAPNPTL